MTGLLVAAMTSVIWVPALVIGWQVRRFLRALLAAKESGIRPGR